MLKHHLSGSFRIGLFAALGGVAGCSGSISDTTIDQANERPASADEALVKAVPGNSIVGWLGKCLSTQGTVTNGTPVVLRSCDGGVDQQWQPGPSAGQIQNTASGKCLNVSGGGSAPGTAVILWNCVSGAANEAFTVNDESLVGIGGMCVNVNVPSNLLAENAPVNIQTCASPLGNFEKLVWERSNVVIRVQAVNVLTDSGTTNGNATSTAFKTAIDGVNVLYAGTGIQFAFVDSASDFSTVRNSVIDVMTEDGNLASNQAAYAASDAIAKGYPGLATVLITDGPGAGNFSWPAADHNFVRFSNFFNSDSPYYLAHELGHYLGLWHTFTYNSNAAFNAHIAGTWTPSDFDGDISNVSDTPPDPGPWAWPLLPDGSTDTTASCGTALTKNGYTFQMDRYNMMSYWGACSPTTHRDLTPDQILWMHHWLNGPRAGLLNDVNPTQVAGLAVVHTAGSIVDVLATGSSQQTGAGGVFSKSKVTADSNADWGVWSDLQVGPVGSGKIAGADFADGNYEVFVAPSSGGTMSTAWTSGSGTTRGFSGWVTFGTPFNVIDIATSHTSDNRTRLYIAGTAGQIAVAEKTTTSSTASWTAWSTIAAPASTVSAITVAPLANGIEEIFAVGTDHKLYTTWQTTPGSAFGGWIVPSGSPLVNDVEAGFTSAGFTQVFAVTNGAGDMTAMHKISADGNSAWSTWGTLNSSLNGFSTVSATRLPNGLTEVFTSKGGVPYTIWNTDTAGTWSVWANF